MTYSKTVYVLKIVLPLIAMAMLASLFLLSRSQTDTPAALPFSASDLDARIREQRISGPIYNGTNAAGDDISLSAGKIIPQITPDSMGQMTDLAIKVATAAGTEFGILAQLGEYDSKTTNVSLRGRVDLTTSSGYQVTSPSVTFDPRHSNLIAQGPIAGHGPNMTLTAGKLEISRPPETESLQIRFTQGIKVILNAPQESLPHD